MIEKVIQLYEYNELSKSAKEKAKQWYLSDPFRSEQLTEDFEESFLKYFFKNSELKVEWSLSSCQGDGVNIYGKLRLDELLDYIEKWNPDEHSGYKNAHDPRGIFTEKEVARLRFYFSRSGYKAVELLSNRRYTYCTASQAELAEDLIKDLEYWELRDLDRKLIHRFEDACVTVVSSLCAEMEDFGYKYLYEVEDEEVQESCEANEWYFTSEGNFEIA